MSVYVDDMRAQFGSLVMCHMVADSHAELVAMADIIKVQRKWIQKPGTIYEHFDICLSKRALAVKYGAQQITMKELGRMLYAWRKAAKNATGEAARLKEGPAKIAKGLGTTIFEGEAMSYSEKDGQVIPGE